MNIKPLFYIPAMLMMPLFAEASPMWFTGTPSNAYTLPPTTKPTPNLGGPLINFDGLPSCFSFPPSGCTNYSGTTFSGDVTITSPDGLYAIYGSSQSSPNMMYDNSDDGSADITISLNQGASAVGVGIADSDIQANGNPVVIYLQALNSLGVGFGPVDDVTLPETGSNPGNGYFYVEDATNDIYGISISQPVGDTGVYFGLAIDDVQASPEPSTLMLLIGGGLAMIGSTRLRKKA
jgi:hypothetical protein